MEHAAHVYATDTDSTSVHNCRRCHRLVIWGWTTKGNRAEFDYPSTADGYVNHHIACRMGNARTGRGVGGVRVKQGELPASLDVLLKAFGVSPEEFSRALQIKWVGGK